MDSSYFTNPLELLLTTLLDAYILIVLLRFLLQWLRADFYNPVSQFVIKITSPVLVPMRRAIPSIGGMDTASLMLAWLLKALALLLVFWIKVGSLSPIAALAFAIPELLGMVINIFLFAILIQVILSWVNPGYNPATRVLDALSDPILTPLRRIIKPIGGLDLSPMAALLGLSLLKMLLLPPLQALANKLL